MSTAKRSFLPVIAALAKIAFGIHALITLTLVLFNFVNLDGMIHGEDLTFTARGRVSVVEKNWRPLDDPKEISINTKDHVSAVFLMIKSGFARFDYSRPGPVLYPAAVLINLLALAILLCWLALTFLIMKIVSSVHKNNAFQQVNILRIKLIGLVFFTAPVLQQLHDLQFSRLARTMIEIPDHVLGPEKATILSPDVVTGFFTMIILLVLAHVFRHGAYLKQESELVI